MRYQCQCNCNSFRFVEQMLVELFSPNRVMPLVPEELRTYPSAVRIPAIGQPGVFESGRYFWGHTDDDYY